MGIRLRKGFRWPTAALLAALLVAAAPVLPQNHAFGQGGDGAIVVEDEGEEAPFFSEEGGLPEPAGEEAEEEPFLSDEEGAGEGESSGDYSRRKLSYRHRYRLLAGGNRTEGVFFFFTGKNQLREARLLNSYQQTIRIEESPTNYKFVKFSIDFAQNYDFESKRFFDNYFVFNEIYLNWRKGKNQYRWGNQIFELGRLDFDSPIDVLHYTNLVGYLTFDTETTKNSIPSYRYDRFGKDQRFTIYGSPIAQRTIGMRFTDFREYAEAMDQQQEPESNSFLRDYVGFQHQWLAKSFDLRLGAFHWFDNNPTISWQYADLTEGSPGSSFENMLLSYQEQEQHSNFLTFELDLNFGSTGWKTDAGYFDKKNFYEYRKTGEDINFGTVRVKHVGVATSLERAFPYFFTLVAYSYRKLYEVPGGTHVMLYENERVPIGEERDLEKQAVTGVFKWLFEGNNNVTLAVSQTFPYEQNTVYAIWGWERPEFNSEWSLKIFHFETKIQQMTGLPIKSTQAFITYTQKMAGD